METGEAIESYSYLCSAMSYEVMERNRHQNYGAQLSMDDFLQHWRIIKQIFQFRFYRKFGEVYHIR